MVKLAKILLFGTMGDIAPIVMETLERDGHEVAAVPFPQNILHDECGYKRQLLKSIDVFNPDIVLPVGNTIAISRIKASVSGLPAIICESPEKTVMLDDKLAASELAGRLGIIQPRIFHSREEVTHFPVIFKRDLSFAGSGVYKPSSPEALERISKHFAGKRFIIEEYVEGCDWSVDAIRAEGYFRYGCYRSLESNGQGPSLLREAADNPELGRIAKLMLDAVDWHGVCGLDFRIGGGGQVYFLECNPRLTGGIATQIRAGFNIPSILVGLFNRGTN